MKKIVISGAMILAASSAYAAVTSTGLAGTFSNGVSVITAPATNVVSNVVPVAAAAVDAIEPVAGAISVGLKPGQGQLPRLASNFNTRPLLVPSWGVGEVPRSNRPEVIGAFRFTCSAGQLRYDDPIVFPGQPGKSHLHQFYGNLSADAYSTYGSLRLKGDSTCGNMLNRSAYWMPAMLDGKGHVVRPDYVTVYYKRLPETSPECQISGKACVALPRGMRYIFGYDMATGKGGHFYFNCDGPTAKPGHYPDIVEAGKNCPVGNRLGVVITAPDCWDGKQLNSSNHRNHVGYTAYNDRGQLICPKDKPYIIPVFTMAAWFTVDENLDKSGQWSPGTSTWSLSSDKMPGMPMMRPGSTMHADWMGAWDDDVMKMWMDNCINKLLSCNGGDLGNRWQMKERPGFSWKANPRLVDVPAV